MLRIGSHISSSKGFLAMGKTAQSIGANTFQFFTRNPRGGAAKELNLDDVEAMLAFNKENDIGQLLAHAPYTLNACAKDESLREFVYNTMVDDLRRLEYIPGAMYNFHPGSHVQQGVEVGIDYIASTLNRVLRPEQSTIVLLETMAGKGSEIGRSFEELRDIIDKVDLKDKIGVCLDTCHVFDGGYDIVNDLENVLQEFDQIIGLDRLKAIHLNDSIHGLNSHKDRHEKLGQGKIGLDTFIAIINHSKLRHLPFYLETPNELEGYAEEIKLLKSNRNVIIDRKKAEEAFQAYVAEYDSSSEKVRLKIEHTYRVSALCEKIAQSLDLPQSEVDIAWLAGLLHDIGRFEQLRNYGTFVDADSIDHAQYGANILFVQGKIRDYLEDDSQDELLRTVVFYHSAFQIPEDLDDRTIMFCNILRDADKIDILKVNVEFPLEEIYNVTSQELRNGEVTKEVMDSFQEEHAVLRSLKKTAVDNVVGHISLVYELVYPISLKLVKEQGYLEQLMNFDSINPVTKKQFIEINKKMQDYLG